MAVDIQKTVNQAFSLVQKNAPQAVKTITIRKYLGDPVYDTTTGQQTQSYQDVTVQAILTNIREREIQQKAGSNTNQSAERTTQVGDMKALIPYSSLQYIPSLEDRVIHGVEWDIITATSDPTESSLVILTIRKA